MLKGCIIWFSYLSLLPALTEDLPVIAVTGVLEAEESSVTEPRVGGVGVQHAEAHHPVPAASQPAELPTLRAPSTAALRFLGFHY